MNKNRQHMLDLCFTVESPNFDYATIPREVILNALKERIKDIEKSNVNIYDSIYLHTDSL